MDQRKAQEEERSLLPWMDQQQENKLHLKAMMWDNNLLVKSRMKKTLMKKETSKTKTLKKIKIKIQKRMMEKKRVRMMMTMMTMGMKTCRLLNMK